MSNWHISKNKTDFQRGAQLIHSRNQGWSKEFNVEKSGAFII